ncbi:MAG: phytanoyl-CoA dioxygenase family protein [Acidobacteriota bacterium]
MILLALRTTGCVIVEEVFERKFMETVRSGLYRGLALVKQRVSEEVLRRAGELGVVRAPMLADDVFFHLLESPAILKIVDAVLSPTAVLHLQNGLILQPSVPSDGPSFQRNLHRDFNRVLNGYVCSLNVLIAVDEFAEENGATMVVLGSHQSSATRPDEGLNVAVPAECAAGSVVVFDSTLWHAAGANTTGHDRCAVNEQFTRSYFKQQIDYVRCIGDASLLRQAERVRQLLGWHTRVPASLEQFYSADRFYRSGQG